MIAPTAVIQQLVDRFAMHLANQMHSPNSKLASSKNSDTTTRLQREIAATDAAIDKLVYGLYGLSEDEVKVVEGGGE